MNIDLYKTLYKEGLISAETLEKAEQKHRNSLFSVHWELKTLLYLGVMLLSTGLGILIYKNIDTIGHKIILLLIALISSGCFFYCIKRKKPFSREKVNSPDALFDYLLLLGCMSLVSFLGYLQFQYQFFGTHYGLATLFPTVILFYVAYEFDHLGILGMAITSMALWMGLTITPAALVGSGVFINDQTICTYLFFGLFLLCAGHLSERYNFKKHFKFNYQHFGLNIAFIALLAGYFGLYNPTFFKLIWLIGVFGLAAILFIDTVKSKSFYFALLLMIYTYIALSCLVMQVVADLEEYTNGVIYFIGILYFIFSAFGFIILLNKLNKKFKSYDHL